MLSYVTSGKQLRAYFKYCQVKIDVQTVHEPHDLNMAFCSFDIGFKQPCAHKYLCQNAVLIIQLR